MAKKKDNDQLRFAVVTNAGTYDIFSIYRLFDDSICVTPYLRNQTHLAIGSIKGEQITKLETTIQTTVYPDVYPKHDFKTNKITFHDSGFIHATNKTGERLKMYDGLQSLRFDEINDWITLFFMYPMSPQNYRLHKGQKNTFFFTGPAEPDSNQMPFQITCYLVKQGFDFKQRSALLHRQRSSSFAEYKDYLPTYGLNLVVRFHRSNLDVFPNEELIGVPNYTKPKAQ